MDLLNRDYVQIGKEVLQITGINDNTFTVTRGQESTTDVDHFDGQEVSFTMLNIILQIIIKYSVEQLLVTYNHMIL